jgi:hypothetical protein
MLTLSEAAEQLGISRAARDNWIKRLGIEKKKEGRIGLTAKEVEQIRPSFFFSIPRRLIQLSSAARLIPSCSAASESVSIV